MRFVVLRALVVEVLGQVILGVAVFIGPYHPQFATAQLLLERIKYTEFVVDPVNALFLLIFFQHQVAPHRTDDPHNRDRFVNRIIDAAAKT